MEEVRVAAAGIGRDGDLSRIVGQMLSGCRAAGAGTRHFLLAPGGETGPATGDGGPEVAATPDEIAASVDIVSASDHIILALSGPSFDSTGPGAAFRAECYRKARWMSLADVMGKYGAEVRISPGSNPADFRFPLPARELSADHRALVVYNPPSRTNDHEDPFRENAFFVIEELARILGFIPHGRILATGLYDPPLEKNALLKEQAFELGRRLVSGAVIARGGRGRA